MNADGTSFSRLSSLHYWTLAVRVYIKLGFSLGRYHNVVALVQRHKRHQPHQ